MNDDWRLQIDFEAEDYADAMLDRLDARELEDDLSEAFHDRVIVSRNDATLFLYAGDRGQAESARNLVEAYAERESEELGVGLTRWHPIADLWMPADEALPDEAAEMLAEHRARIALEREESEEQGYPEWEVRIDLPSRKDADEFADRFRAKGLPVVERWKYVLLGAMDEEGANTLAELSRAEAPAGSRVVVRGTFLDIREDMLEAAGLPRSPFAVFP